MSKPVCILDYGSGNIGSLVNMFKYIGVEPDIISDVELISSRSALVLPGVGHFSSASEKLRQIGADKAIINHAKAGGPLLGICLGMQLLFTHSDEGNASGLGLLKGKVTEFQRTLFSRKLPVPHVGWNHVDPITSAAASMLENMPTHPRFYFVHSYHVDCTDRSDVMMETTYGYKFACAVKRKNITGFQFHPEKSHSFGMALLNNWVNHINDQ